MSAEGGRDVTTWEVLVVLALGALVGFVILFADEPSWDHAHRAAARSGAVVLWTALMCAQTALWALALAWLFPTIRALPPKYAQANRSEIVGSSLAILAILLALGVAGMVHPMWPNYLPGHAVKLGVLTIVGGLVGLVAARGLWLVHGGLKLLGKKDLASAESLREFLSLQADADRFLGVLGAIIGLLVLSTGAQRRAVLSYSPHTHYGFELVLVYGFLFTILVAAVYLPTYLTLTDVGTRIRDAVFPEVAPSRPEWADRLEQRQKLGAVLRLERGPFSRLKASIAILTPLLGSLVGLLLNAR